MANKPHYHTVVVRFTAARKMTLAEVEAIARNAFRDSAINEYSIVVDRVDAEPCNEDLLR